MEPKATPHRAACKRWGMVGGGAGRGGLSNARGVHELSAGWRAEWGRARAGDGPVDETPGRAWANVRGLMCAGSFVRQRERNASGKRAAPGPRTGRTLAVVGGRSRTGTPSFKMGLSPDIPRAKAAVQELGPAAR